MKKKLSTVLPMALSLLLLISSMAFAEGLRDIELSPYKMEIEKLVSDKVILGYSDGTFKPEDTITRVELASVLTKALKFEEDGEVGRRFTDVVGKWSEGIVGAIYKKRIMIGKSETFFGADDQITKEEMAVLLLRAFNLEEIANKLELESNFLDSDKISLWAKNAVVLAHKIELIDSVKNEDETMSIEPKVLLDRQMVAKLIYELIHNKEIYMERINSIIDFEVNPDGDKGETKDEAADKEEPGKGKEDNPSYDSIVARYISKLSSAESKYTGLLDSLFSQAKAEYDRDGDKPNFSVITLYKEYEGKARILEGEADSEVREILSQLESELNQYGYGTSIVDELYSEYEDKKTAIEVEI